LLKQRPAQLIALPRDALAGLLLAAIAIPEQLATARLAGLPPEAGLFTFAAGAVGFAVFGTNRFLSAGADSTIAPIFAGGLAMLVAVSTPDYAALAALLSVMVGIVLIGSALLHAGWVADLLSVPSVLPSFCGLRRGVRKESGKAEILWKRIRVVLAGFVCCLLAERDSAA
jgi:MFS superfamily sulfate permease-like transporter